MTRKDYELLARALHQTRIEFGPHSDLLIYNQCVDNIAMTLAAKLATENHNFRPETFLLAAGVTKERAS